MGRRIVSVAVLLSVCTTLAGVASAGVFVFPASSVVAADKSKRGSGHMREIPMSLLYDGDPSDLSRSEDRMEKRASNLGSRLMCQLDSRNCGTFNMGKKFGRFSWLRSADSTWRRLQYELGGHRWERGIEGRGEEWRDDDDGGSQGIRGEKRPLEESGPTDELQILRLE